MHKVPSRAGTFRTVIRQDAHRGPPRGSGPLPTQWSVDKVRDAELALDRVHSDSCAETVSPAQARERGGEPRLRRLECIERPARCPSSVDTRARARTVSRRGAPPVAVIVHHRAVQPHFLRGALIHGPARSGGRSSTLPLPPPRDAAAAHLSRRRKLKMVRSVRCASVPRMCSRSCTPDHHPPVTKNTTAHTQTCTPAGTPHVRARTHRPHKMKCVREVKVGALRNFLECATVRVRQRCVFLRPRARTRARGAPSTSQSHSRAARSARRATP